ncbi:MAG: hypothetical protein A2428_12535 [Bdellovibrionales bacterium RIFOXYC1_FULL_54_43]|nr:MAG: hypothetical protein A2428_12535 [Bdellovibrionales bacterium RIFOXYC1_FULL_54_43]OFZ81875.1 MAG: hypothetical protein A2603_08025 [Bdellovibrionales bacterium RIFOXYD1_FULL_55_31]
MRFLENNHRFARLFAVLLIPLVLFSVKPGSPALAAYNHPATWASVASHDFDRATQGPSVSRATLFEPSFSDATFSAILSDTDRRVPPTFQIPNEIRNSVGFWLRIYSQFTTHHIVLFDESHPEIVYEALDFRNVAESARSRLVYEVIVKNRVAATLKAYRLAFASLAKHPRPKSPTREEALILAATSKLPHRHSFHELAQRLRTQTGQRDNIVKGLATAEGYFPKMEAIFSKIGLPPALVRLSLVESSFNVNAISRAGASGVWQFLPRSGKEYLVIDSNLAVDERLSPLKATVAAGKLLKRNFRTLNSWALAITAYNHGAQNLRRFSSKAADFSKISHIFKPCTKRRHPVGWASRNYYAEFLAVLHAEAYRSLLYGDFSEPPQHSVAFRKLNRAQSAVSFALERGISLARFRRLNPDIMNLHKRLPRGFLVAVPDEADDLGQLTNAGRGQNKLRKG